VFMLDGCVPAADDELCVADCCSIACQPGLSFSDSGMPRVQCNLMRTLLATLLFSCVICNS
jgi:hypothetical protein